MMTRNSLLRSSLIARILLADHPSTNLPSSTSHPSFLPFSTKTLITTTRKLSPRSSSFPSFSEPLFFSSLFPSRSFSSSSSTDGAPNIVAIKSEEDFNASLKKAQDDASPSIFYFTATWCGPCRMLSPVIEELSKTYPHVTTYKIDIDLEVLQRTLSKLQIYSVPTLHFFHDGKKATEVVGADITLLKQTMESLYKQA